MDYGLGTIAHTFSYFSLMVSVGVSKLDCTGLILVGVKINRMYYCDVILPQQLLLHGNFIFQQCVRE